MRLRDFTYAAVAAFSLGAASSAYAGPIDNLVITGGNNAEDDSAEGVFRCDTSLAVGSQCVRLAKGSAIRPAPVGTEFDVFAGVLDFNAFNGQQLSGTAPASELTGVFVAAIAGFTDTDSNGIDAGDVVSEVGVGADIFKELTGVDLATIAAGPGFIGTAADTLAVLYTGADELGSIITNGANSFATAIAAATNGSLAAVAGIVEADDYFDATLTTFGGLDANSNGILNALEVGVDTSSNNLNTELFSLELGLSFQAYELIGSEFVANGQTQFRTLIGADATNDIVGGGAHTKPGGGDSLPSSVYDLANDIDVSFTARRVSEPGTMALVGLSLIGVGAVTRRRRKS